MELMDPMDLAETADKGRLPRAGTGRGARLQFRTLRRKRLIRRLAAGRAGRANIAGP